MESKKSENVDPNLSDSRSGHGHKQSGSPLVKSASNSQKSAPKNPNPHFYSPRNKIRERRFVVAKKKSKKETGDLGVTCKCKDKDKDGNTKKCLCVAYENLRASQEEFFKSRNGIDQNDQVEDELEKNFMINLQIEDGYEEEAKEPDDPNNGGEIDELNQMGMSSIKRRREKVLEEARKSVPEPGSGRVKFLVRAFEESQKVMAMAKKTIEEDEKKGLRWGLPGMEQQQQDPVVVSEAQVSLSSVCPSDLFLTSEKLGLDGQFSVSSSWDSSRGSIASQSSNGGGQRSRRKSTESSATGGVRRWKKQQKHPRVTSLKPFRLRTEQRGRMKEEEFMKKLQEMTIEEQKQRIPIAQGLPWTTDEPECLIKPPVKEITRPVDLMLHSDVRAVERAEFDHQVAEKMSLIEQYKMERERQQKMAEEEEIKRLRKELVPKAQPMPYFDRPFIPKRSEKNPTIPVEPRFHIPQHKKIKYGLSWNDVCSYTNHE